VPPTYSSLVLRRFFNLAATLSLVLACATIAMWARSLWRFDCFQIDSARGTIRMLNSMSGGLGLVVIWPAADGEDPPQPWSWDSTRAPPGHMWGPSYSLKEDFMGTGSPILEVVLPYWMLFVLSLPLALVAGRRVGKRLLRSRRRARGLCPTCGYDLRESQERCPECGGAQA
jgi:hypothetical protein